MLSDKTNSCERLTKMSIQTQNQKLRLFAKVDILTKLKILESQKTLFYKLKELNRKEDNAVLMLSSLIIAVEKTLEKFDDVDLNVSKFHSKNLKRIVKRERLLAHWATVRNLKLEKKMSFRNISKYFMQSQKFEVSWSTIYNMWIELEGKEKEEKSDA